MQIRDPARALPGQYVTERSESALANMPPRWRRIVVTCLYLVTVTILVTVIGIALLSPACLNRSFCSAGERVFDQALNITLLVMMAFTVALGWNGKLPGARRL